MKTFVSLFVFALLGQYLAAASDDEVEHAFEDGALMTLECPEVINAPCFVAQDSERAAITVMLKEFLSKKWNELRDHCDDRRQLRGGTAVQQQRGLQGCAWCAEQPYLCTFGGNCRRELDEANHPPRGLDGDGENTVLRDTATKLMSRFLDLMNISYNDEESECMSGITCTLEYVITYCDE